MNFFEKKINEVKQLIHRQTESEANGAIVSCKILKDFVRILGTTQTRSNKKIARLFLLKMTIERL